MKTSSLVTCLVLRELFIRMGDSRTLIGNILVRATSTKSGRHWGNAETSNRGRCSLLQLTRISILLLTRSAGIRLDGRTMLTVLFRSSSLLLSYNRLSSRRTGMYTTLAQALVSSSLFQACVSEIRRVRPDRSP
jgi:hypothetical protein